MSGSVEATSFAFDGAQSQGSRSYRVPSHHRPPARRCRSVRRDQHTRDHDVTAPDRPRRVEDLHACAPAGASIGCDQISVPGPPRLCRWSRIERVTLGRDPRGHGGRGRLPAVDDCCSNTGRDQDEHAKNDSQVLHRRTVPQGPTRPPREIDTDPDTTNSEVAPTNRTPRSPNPAPRYDAERPALGRMRAPTVDLALIRANGVGVIPCSPGGRRASRSWSVEPVLHPDIASLAALIGKWSGHGHGEYPTIELFDYDETIAIAATGKPFLAYEQRTRDRADGRPLHRETGFWRVPEPGRIELVIAHPTGIVEIDEGTFDGGLIRLRATTVGRTATAKDVTAIGATSFLMATRCTTPCAWPQSANPSPITFSPNYGTSHSTVDQSTAGSRPPWHIARGPQFSTASVRVPRLRIVLGVVRSRPRGWCCRGRARGQRACTSTSSQCDVGLEQHEARGRVCAA